MEENKTEASFENDQQGAKPKEERKAEFSSSSQTSDSASETSPENDSSNNQKSEASGPAQDPVAEWKTRVVYLTAEMDNMRKRFAREIEDYRKKASEDVLKLMLPVLDNFQLAVTAIRQFRENEALPLSDQMPKLMKLMEGVEMTLKHFENTLEQAGLKPIPSVGLAFDPAVHEAIGQAEDSNYPSQIILQEVQRGFILGGRTLRPARVIVNK